MMSVNDVLMKFFKLPPGVRMMMALLGFGSLATVFFAIKRFLWPMIQRGQWLQLGIIAGVLVFGILIVWIIVRMRKRASAKKGSALEGEIAKQEAVGDSDAREAQKANREKFQEKLRKLKELDKNVYDLPWYILLGEPGCGKTASLIYSGVDFPLGSEEVAGFGGTRNYNWWFANQAIILDTAGRLAFHEEGTSDRPEWEGFLQLLRRNRPSCPINGVVVAIPANALLNDSSETRNQKSTMLRERLRQLAQSLGVRFPVYLLITKTDLVAGFSEFFDEFKQDVPLRKQMIGWSRPGEFQQPYDPATFGDAFDGVYQRLRDYAMRYLQRPMLERELGMIVTFPEAFRALRKPLEEYISKVFQKSPLVEPPFFRGFYFTSACQEGAPILSIFDKSHVGGVKTQSIGGRAPDSKPFFIQSVYEEKVFQENGLTFRSSKDVAVSRRTRTLVWSGCAAMIVAMAGFFWYGSTVVRDLVTRPGEDCQAATKRLKALQDTGASLDHLPADAELAAKLRAHDERFASASWFKFKMLYIGASPQTPRRYVGTIYSSLVIGSLIRPVERIIAEELPRLQPAAAPPNSTARKSLLAAVVGAARWFADAARTAPLALTDSDASVFAGDYRAMLTVARTARAAPGAAAPASAPAAEATVGDPVELAAKEVEALLRLLAGDGASLGGTVLKETCRYDPTTRAGQLAAAIERLKDGWLGYARIDDKNADSRVKYWIDLVTRVEAVRGLYREVLALSEPFKSDQRDPAALAAARDRFLLLSDDVNLLGKPPQPGDPEPKAGTLAAAVRDLLKHLREPVPQSDNRILRLRDLFGILAAYWDAEFRQITQALDSRLPEGERAAPPGKTVYEKLAGISTDLQAQFNLSAREWLKSHGLPEDADPLRQYMDEGLLTCKEKEEGKSWEAGDTVSVSVAPEAWGMTLQPPRGTDAALRVTLAELRDVVLAGGRAADLSNFREWPGLLGSAGGEIADAQATLRAWVKAVEDQRKANPGITGSTLDNFISNASAFGRSERFWNARRTYDLIEAIRFWRKNVGQAGLMRAMADAARATTQSTERIEGLLPTRGLGRLMPEWREPAKGLPFLKRGADPVAPAAAATPAVSPAATPAAQPVDPFAPRPREPVDKPPVATAPATEPPPQPPADPWLMRKYHTRNCLGDTFLIYEDLGARLKSSPGEGEAGALLRALEEAAKAYAEDYFDGWSVLYNDCDLLLGKEMSAFLARCRGSIQWSEFAATVGAVDNRFGREASDRLNAFREHVAQFDGLLVGPQPPALGEDAAGSITRAVDLRDKIPAAIITLRTSAVAVADLWAQYAAGVKAVKWPAKAASDAAPNVKALEDGLVSLGDNRIARALVAIARFGNDLLRYEVESKFRGVFAGRERSFPFGDGPAVSPADLERTVIEASTIEAEYGALLRALSGDAMKATLDATAAWRNFLWGGRDPTANVPLVVDVTVTVEPKAGGGFQNFGEVWKKMTYTLPLESEAGGPMQKVDIDLLDASDPGVARRFRFNLRGAALPPLDIRVRDKNAAVQGAADPQMIVQGGSNPLEFLKILDKSAGGLWRRSWDTDVQGFGRVGCDLKVNVGAGTAAYPGTIPAPVGGAREPDRSALDVCK